MPPGRIAKIGAAATPTSTDAAALAAAGADREAAAAAETHILPAQQVLPPTKTLLPSG